MKEKLLHTADSLQEIDTVGSSGVTQPSRWSSPVSPDGIFIEFPSYLTESNSQPSTLSGSLAEHGVQLHHMSRASDFSSVSGVSAVSAVSGGGSSQANESFEKD
jgi:hypothetical protein